MMRRSFTTSAEFVSKLASLCVLCENFVISALEKINTEDAEMKT